jgi:hypothetical protein
MGKYGKIMELSIEKIALFDYRSRQSNVWWKFRAVVQRNKDKHI